MKTYEKKETYIDPFDIMVGESVEHVIELWKPVTLEELHEDHKGVLLADSYLTDVDRQQYEDIYGEPYKDFPKDFNTYLLEKIAMGTLREV